jgi:hypothetical protein
VAYRFDPQRQIVVLDGMGETGTPASGVLCARHAAAMVLPKGWWLDDRRLARPSLFSGTRAGGDTEKPPAAPRVRRARRPRPVADAPPEPLPLESVAEPQLVTEPELPAEEAEVSLWTPEFDVQDDLGGLLRAESPLLSRAFGGRARKGKRAPS